MFFHSAEGRGDFWAGLDGKVVIYLQPDKKARNDYEAEDKDRYY
jgi:hypothetical protein